MKRSTFYKLTKIVKKSRIIDGQKIEKAEKSDQMRLKKLLFDSLKKVQKSHEEKGSKLLKALQTIKIYQGFRKMKK